MSADPSPSLERLNRARQVLIAASLAALALGRALAAAPAIARRPSGAVLTSPASRALSPEALAERIAAISARYRGTPYRRDPLGEGPAGTVDRDPLICASAVDCQTFVEQVLAEAIAPRPEAVLPLLTRIRYRDGFVGYGTRNHYLVSDWLPHNRWLVRDVTASVAGAAARPMEKVIDRAAFFRAHGAPELGRGIQPERCRTLYIPRASLSAVTRRIPNGAILIWVQSRPGIIAAHCGFAIRDRQGALLFRHASERRGRVVDEPLLAFARQAPPRFVGLKVCQAFPPLDIKEYPP